MGVKVSNPLAVLQGRPLDLASFFYREEDFNAVIAKPSVKSLFYLQISSCHVDSQGIAYVARLRHCGKRTGATGLLNVPAT